MERHRSRWWIPAILGVLVGLGVYVGLSTRILGLPIALLPATPTPVPPTPTPPRAKPHLEEAARLGAEGKLGGTR